ncbi:MAG: hypothetical protein ABIA67_03270 [Candidatus Margulisiibacteriota bacterium]
MKATLEKIEKLIAGGNKEVLDRLDRMESDLGYVKNDVSSVKQEIGDKIDGVKRELGGKIDGVHASLKNEISVTAQASYGLLKVPHAV